MRTWVRSMCLCGRAHFRILPGRWTSASARSLERSEEHTSELQSQSNLVCRLLLEKKKKDHNKTLGIIYCLPGAGFIIAVVAVLLRKHREDVLTLEMMLVALLLAFLL